MFQRLINRSIKRMASQVFSVKREVPELIVPATPTPHEVKRLSDIDDQEGLRFQIPLIFFYRNTTSTKAAAGKDPVKVFREGLSKTLVFYYPLAGRLREGPNRKLLVDCNSEGVLFIEAEANVTIDELGEVIRPPFPCLDELLYNVSGSDGIVGCPLLLIQTLAHYLASHPQNARLNSGSLSMSPLHRDTICELILVHRRWLASNFVTRMRPSSSSAFAFLGDLQPQAPLQPDFGITTRVKTEKEVFSRKESHPKMMNTHNKGTSTAGVLMA